MSFLTYLISGLSLGSIYAIIALGYTMVYGIAKMLNFAHGDFIMVGCYIIFSVTASLGGNPLLGILVAVVLCTILGITTEFVAYRPLRGAASPEGPYDNNVRLARERTQNLADYVAKNYNVDRGKIATEYEPEDWDGLKKFIREATLEQLPNREALLAIAGSNLPHDKKERHACYACDDCRPDSVYHPVCTWHPAEQHCVWHHCCDRLGPLFDPDSRTVCTQAAGSTCAYPVR